jgi:anti-sigma factor RsiW
MRVECNVLGAMLSERRRGELSLEESRALDAHLSQCARCREEAEALGSVLEAVELPPIGPAELEALRARRIGQGPPAAPRRRGWRIPAALSAAAAAALLTLAVRPAWRHPEPGRGAALPTMGVAPGGDSQELFPELWSEASDDSMDSAEDDAQLLEGPGLFGNLDG